MTTPAVELDYTRLGAVLAVYGTCIYDPDASLSGTDGRLYLDPLRAATAIREHAEIVQDALWTEKVGRRELLSPTTTGQLETDEDWDDWTLARRGLLDGADPISARWLSSIFHLSDRQDETRAGWSHLEMIPPNSGLNIIRRVHKLAEHLARRDVDDIIDGLTGDTVRELGPVQVTGGTWDRRGQKSAGIDAVWGWLSLMGMTAVPATPTGTICCVGSKWDGFIVLPLAEGPVAELVCETIPAVDAALSTAVDLAMIRRVPELPYVHAWQIETHNSGSSTTRRAIQTDLDKVFGAIHDARPDIPDQHLRMTGAELTAIQHALGCTAAELADLLGRDPRTISRWISGETPIPSQHVAAIFALGRRQTRLAAELSSADPKRREVLQSKVPAGFFATAAGRAVLDGALQIPTTGGDDSGLDTL